ncbi:MAG: hypothetical protein FWD73_11515 [Polyangiaceae bacterium]|nr:hypothetical protein [Polyangiaceae bacterium]
MRHTREVVLFALAIVGCSTPFGTADASDSGQSNAGQGDGRDGGPVISPGPENIEFVLASTRLRVVQGQPTKVPIVINRKGMPASDIAITITGLPQGVTAASLTIPSSASTGDLEITVTSDVAQGPIDLTMKGQAASSNASASAILSLIVGGPPGTLDTTFAPNGPISDVFGVNSQLINLFVSSDDHIYVLGQCNGAAGSYSCIARFNSEGVIDNTYGTSGIAWPTDTSSYYSSESSNAAALLPDGRIILGTATDNNVAAYSMVSSDGKSSPTTALPICSSAGATASFIQSMAVAPDGNVFIVFDAGSGMAVAKLASDGSHFDLTFGNGGCASATFTTPDTHSSSTGIVVRPEGEIVIVGQHVVQASVGYGILQLDKSGAYDTLFGTNGQTTLPIGIMSSTTQNPVLLADGRVVSTIFGYSVYGAIMAIKADGTGLDTTFGAGSGELWPPYTSDGMIWNPYVTLDHQDRLLVAGTSDIDQSGHVWRYDDKGAPDTSFGTSGRTEPFPMDGSMGSAIARVQSDGRIVVVSASNGAVAVSRYWD